jgi:alkylated DNA nucleotide flippase Atl1
MSRKFANTTERVAVVAWELCNGRGLTAKQVAELTGLSHAAAYKMLEKLSLAFPLVKVGQVWSMMEGVRLPKITG